MTISQRILELYSHVASFVQLKPICVHIKQRKTGQSLYL